MPQSWILHVEGKKKRRREWKKNYIPPLQVLFCNCSSYVSTCVRTARRRDTARDSERIKSSFSDVALTSSSSTSFFFFFSWVLPAFLSSSISLSFFIHSAASSIFSRKRAINNNLGYAIIRTSYLDTPRRTLIAGMWAQFSRTLRLYLRLLL